MAEPEPPSENPGPYGISEMKPSSIEEDVVLDEGNSNYTVPLKNLNLRVEIQ